MVNRPFVCLLLPPSQTWENPFASASYRVQDHTHTQLGPVCSIRLNALAQLPAHLPLYVLLHPLDTVIQSVTLPITHSRQQTQAAPWLLEPYLLSDPDSQHVVLSGSLALAVHKTLLPDLLKRLRAAERLPVWVGALSLAASAQGQTAAQTTAQIWQDDVVAVGMVPSQAPIVLPVDQRMLLQTQLPPAVVHEAAAWPDLSSDPTTWPGNLLQGIYAQQGAQSGWLDSLRGRGNLRWLMALAAVWVVALNIDAWRLAQQKKQLQQQLTHAMQKTFPQLPLIVEPRLQAEQQLTLLRAQQGGANTQDECLQLLEKASGPAHSFSASLRALHYQAPARILQLNFQANALSPERQQTLTAAWQAAGLRAVWGDVVGSDLSVQLSVSSPVSTAQTGGGR